MLSEIYNIDKYIEPIISTTQTRKCITRNGKSRLFTVICGSDGAKIPKFNNVQVSTMTIIAHTNIIINTQKFFKYMPITDYLLVKKKRGRKKKIHIDDPNEHIIPGSIISLTKKRNVRGVILKPKKKKSMTFFRHSVSVVMILKEGKMLNVKVSRGGKLQMTGCKSIAHAVEFVKYIYKLMIETEKWTGETLFTYKDKLDANMEDQSDDIEDEKEPVLKREIDHGLTVVFRCVMKNIDFDIGYKIRRDLLNTYINRHTDFRSVFESSIKASGVNIKMEASNRRDNSFVRLKITPEGNCIEDTITSQSFFDNLPEKDRNDDRKKEQYHTFLIFASGSIIMSSSGSEMAGIFYKLVEILIENRNKIEEIGDNHSAIIDSSWIDVQDDKKD